MTNKIIPATLLFIGLCCIFFATSAQQPAYRVPANYTFDYAVVQQVKSQKEGTTTLNYFYTKAGEYSGIRPDKDKNKLIIFTKDGFNIVIDDQMKTIMVLRLGNMMAGMAAEAAQRRKGGTAPSTTVADTAKGKSKFEKTGNTKQISGYTAEEYSFTNSKGESGTVWCAKVDFSASLFGMGGMGASSPGIPSSMNKSPQMQSYPAITDPHLMVAETTSAAHPGEGISTQSITKNTIEINTAGYKVTDLSNMAGMKELMDMKNKQN